MDTARTIRLPRRILLGASALIAATVAAVGLTGRPAQARPRAVECVADLIETA
ncbi:hypothetical protein AB0M79_01110 [Polymorphospora sp. NPDC051019]|uniref:hypothetical protein n=1 Tax=Polymorphospora sp. NPDC051019 TaxID=3155725 RepID=UPI0034148A85